MSDLSAARASAACGGRLRVGVRSAGRSKTRIINPPGRPTYLSEKSVRTSEATLTDILVASHHGRENGFCPEVFNYCEPAAVIISDKPIEHATQEMVPDYRAVVKENGVPVRTTGKRRHVLTTRRDGWIQITAGNNGYYNIDTEYNG